MITSYAFGKMTIATRSFSSDLIIFPDGRIQDNWYRRTGHLLEMTDLKSLVAEKPNLIITGTGAYGRMALAASLETELDSLGIKIRAMATPEAITLYNKMIQDASSRSISACFHLTC